MTPSPETFEPTPSPRLANLRRTLKAFARAVGEILSGPGATGRLAP